MKWKKINLGRLPVLSDRLRRQWARTKQGRAQGGIKEFIPSPPQKKKPYLKNNCHALHFKRRLQ